MRFLLIIVIIALIIAFSTNPTKEDLCRYLVNTSNEDQELLGLEKFFLDTIMIETVAPLINHENYLFFSIFKSRYLDEDFNIIGVFNNFYSLDIE